MYISGEPLKALRKTVGLTVKELEEKSGVSKKTIEKIEGGVGNPQYSTLVQLADVFQVPIDFLCGRNIGLYNVDGSGDDTRIVYHDKENNIKTARLLSYLHLHEAYKE